MVAKKIIEKALQKALQTAIWIYQLFIVPLLPTGSCRFHPTCSNYAMKAIGIHGPFRGSWLSLIRIFRCNPWGTMGIDDVPPRKKKKLDTTMHITG